MIYLVLLSPLIAVSLYYLYRRLLAFLKKARREKIIQNDFPEVWRNVLREEFSLFNKLPEELKRKLEKHILVFLDEKNFVGCDGFQVDDKVRLLIAAQACILILNIRSDYFPGFENILVYPDTYLAESTRYDGYLRTDSVDVRAGESWRRGPVVLAWQDVKEGAANVRDGSNVVLHEFAHKLDGENVHMDGLPVLARHVQRRSWAKVLSKHFEQLKASPDKVIDSYGAKSPAEFFSVVTEVFFEKPEKLKEEHPELYQQFQLYYQLDPASWGS